MKSKFLGLIILGFLSGVVSLKAAVFVVTNTANAGPGTLRQAILNANAAAGDDAIDIPVTGTISLTSELPAITDSVAITGPGTNLLTIHGNGLARIFFMNQDTTNSLSDLTIAGGWVHGAYINFVDYLTNASGISSDGSLIMHRCIVRDCQAWNSRGAGIYNGGDLELEDCAIINCGMSPSMPTDEGRGGGVYNTGTLRVKDSLISGCRGYGNGPTGGGIYNAGTAELINTRIDGCLTGPAADGGGIANYGSLSLRQSVITNCVGYWAGGIENVGDLTMTNTVVTGNAGRYGGGVLMWGTALFSRCTISGNRCDAAGGGIMSGGNLTMYNCTLSQNYGSETAIYGVAIADKFYGNGTTYLNHCTVVSNTGPQEISAQGNFAAANSILGTCYGALKSDGHNLIVDASSVSVIGICSNNIYNVNPLLGPLQDNGGPTPTHALLTGSCAIDHAECGGLSTDQRGFARPASPLASDIGAFEVISVVPPTLRIAQTAPGSVVVSWESSPAAFVLQQKSVLKGGLWQDLETTPHDDGTNRWVTLPTDGGSGWFRLRSP